MMKPGSALMEPARVWRLFVQTFGAWSSDKVPRHGAALAYYTVLSLVPLLVVIIGMIGLIFGQEAAQGYIVEQIAALVGPQSAAAIKDMIQRANQPTTGIVATVVATATLLLGASGVFGQLQDSLNSIWGVQPKEGRGIWGLIKDRFISFARLARNGVSAPRFPRAQRRARRLWQMVWRVAAGPGGRAPSARVPHLVCRHHWSVRDDV